MNKVGVIPSSQNKRKMRPALSEHCRKTVVILSYTQSVQKTSPHAVLKKSSTHAGFCVVDVGGLTGVVPTPPACGKPPRCSSLKI
jgi:hypothetical protein